MSRRTGVLPHGSEGKDALAMMVAMSERPWFILHPGLVSPTRTMPTREEMIRDDMSVAHYTPYIDESGAHDGPATYLTREQAERYTDAFLADYARSAQQVEQASIERQERAG